MLGKLIEVNLLQLRKADTSTVSTPLGILIDVILADIKANGPIWVIELGNITDVRLEDPNMLSPITLSVVLFMPFKISKAL
ncbi:hypothetical protein Barb6_03290 [Bacteroidales bacterium Barb6]|nr:hypothetical protein Barb6_03290 [Bacteroidales bacterium Barb6]